MRNRSSTWINLAAKGRFSMEAKARINGVDYTSISAPQISRSLMSSPLVVGNCVTATLSLSILTKDPIAASSPITILGRLVNGTTTSEWMEFGTFYIDQRDNDYDGLVTVDCYDAMLKANQAYLSDSDTTGWPKTMREVVEEIAYRIGVGVDPRTKIRTGDDYVVPAPTGKSMMQVLGYIGACHGGNWIISEDNLLRLVPLVSPPAESFYVIDHNYDRIRTSDGGLLIYDEAAVETQPDMGGDTPDSAVQTTHYITDELGQPIVTQDGHYLIYAADGSTTVAVDGLINVPIVCGTLTTGTSVTVTGVTASDEAGNSYTSGNSSGFVLSVESNPYMTQAICDSLYTVYNGLVYAPYTATKACYDPATELGDQVKIGDTVRSVILSTNIKFDIDFRSDISAPNSEELSAEYPYLTEIQKLKQSTEALSTAITKTAEELTETVEESGNNVEALATALQQEIDRASGVEQELVRRIGDEEAKSKDFETRIANLESSVKSINAHLDQMSTDIASLKSANETVQNVAAEIESLKSKADEQAQIIAEQSNEITSLKEAVNANAKTITDLTERIAALENAGNTGV